jgi:hypothetical protein
MTIEETIRATIQKVQNDTLYDGRGTEENRLVEAVKGLVENARRDALLEAAKAMCPFCKHDFEIAFNGRLGYVHLDKEGRVFTDCKSFLIQELIAADQGQGGERS